MCPHTQTRLGRDTSVRMRTHDGAVSTCVSWLPTASLARLTLIRMLRDPARCSGARETICLLYSPQHVGACQNVLYSLCLAGQGLAPGSRTCRPRAYQTERQHLWQPLVGGQQATDTEVTGGESQDCPGLPASEWNVIQESPPRPVSSPTATHQLLTPNAARFLQPAHKLVAEVCLGGR